MISEFVSLITIFVLNLVDSVGYIGIFVGMAIESSFIPFPSEVIMIPAGALIAQGKLLFIPALLAGAFGSLLGALVNFFLAFFLGRKTIDFLVNKYGKFFLLDEEKLSKSDSYFKKHGDITTFVGRFVPVIRQLISLPAGFSKMNLAKFSFFTTLGAGIWSFILLLVGYLFGANSAWVSQNMNLLILTLLELVLIAILVYIIKKKKISKVRSKSRYS